MAGGNFSVILTLYAAKVPGPDALRIFYAPISWDASLDNVKRLFFTKFTSAIHGEKTA